MGSAVGAAAGSGVAAGSQHAAAAATAAATAASRVPPALAALKLKVVNEGPAWLNSARGAMGTEAAKEVAVLGPLAYWALA